MADKVIMHNLSGVQIGQRSKDGYVNATALCKAHNQLTGDQKLVKDWYGQERHVATIRHLAEKLGLLRKDSSPFGTTTGFWGLVIVIKGGNQQQGTWLHPRLAVRFAIWLSDDFGFAVEEIIEAWSLGLQAPKNDFTTLYLEAAVIRSPKQWEVHFSPDWIREAERLTGYSWKWSCMASFINRSVYDTFPQSFRDRLDEFNPILETGKRARKQHQHIAPTADEKILKQVIAETLGMMRGSTSEQDYWRSHGNAYSNGFQLTLFFEGDS